MLPVLGLTLLLPSPPFLMTLVMPNSHRARVAAAPLVNAVDPLGATRRVGVAKVALAVQSELLLMPPLGANPDPAIHAPRGTDYKSGAAGLEPATSWSQTRRATVCATPRRVRVALSCSAPKQWGLIRAHGAGWTPCPS